MICPKCGNEVLQQNASILYGIKDGQIDILAEGEFVIAFCCGVAILAEKQNEHSLIETQPQSIILPT